MIYCQMLRHALTTEVEKTKKALLEAGAEMVLGLDPRAEGITIVDERVEDEAAAAGESQ